MSLDLSTSDLGLLDAVLRDFQTAINDPDVHDDHAKDCPDCKEGVEPCYRPHSYWQQYGRMKPVERLRAAIETAHLAQMGRRNGV